MLRWIFQIAAMLGDMLIILAVAVLWWQMPGLIALVLTILTYRAWCSTGGFIAWTPSGIRAFVRNAKAHGL